MKLPESARLQIDLAFKRFKDKIVEGEVSTKWGQYQHKISGYKDHCYIDIYVDGKRLPLVMRAQISGKTQLKRAPRLAKAMLSEIKNRASECT